MTSARHRRPPFAAALVGAACVVCVLGLAGHFARRSAAAARASTSATLAPSSVPSYVIHEDFDPFRGLSDDEAVARRSNGFSVALFRAARRPGENAFVVTTGVRSALGMAALGARGQTRAELLRVLALPDDDEAIIRESGGELRSLSTVGDVATVRTASRLYLDRSSPPLPAFVEATRRGWKAPAEALGFRGDAGAAQAHVASAIGTLAGEAARGALAPDVIAPDTELLLVNGASFALSWVSPFASDQTRAQPFATPKGPAVAQLMRHTQFAHWRKRPGRMQVSLETYAGLGLQLVLPLPPHDLDRVVADLDAQVCGETDDHDGEIVDLALPRVELSSANDLREPLRKLGLSRVFSSTAELGGITGRGEGQGLHAVVQGAAFSLEEGGVGPGATWSLQGSFGRPRPQPPATVRFDRPFLFLLCAWDTKRIVAIGQIVDPTKGG